MQIFWLGSSDHEKDRGHSLNSRSLAAGALYCPWLLLVSRFTPLVRTACLRSRKDRMNSCKLHKPRDT